MIRAFETGDAAGIAQIYNHYVLHTTVSFENEALSLDAMRQRLTAIASSYPCLVDSENGEIRGYCYAHQWKERVAYAHTWETTVYIAPRHIGKRIGEHLMNELIERSRTSGRCRALVACITGDNAASIALHEKLGFTKVSHFPQVGRKFDVWLDVVDYELLL